MPNIKNWIMAALLVLAVATTYLSYHLYGQVQVVEVQLETARKQIEDKTDALNKLDASCGITSAISTTFIKESREIGSQTQELLTALEEYSRTQETSHEPKQPPKAASAVVAEPDADLQRLLDAAYCAAANDSTCTAK